MNVLVSGVAGDIGFGVARVLQAWGIFDKIYGMDTHSDHAGEIVVDKCAIAPKANDASYLPWLLDFVKSKCVDIFIPTSEAEINILVQSEVYELAGAKVIINKRFTVQKSLDKFECLNYLLSKNVLVPDNGVVGISEPKKYPVIVKPRSGQGSKGVRLVSDSVDLQGCQNGWVWQQYLEKEEQEYTCPVYSSATMGLQVLVIKRKLIGGLTGSGIVVENKEIESYVREIAKAVQLEGSMNVQLRLTDNGPLLFEINPRISSTVVFRDKMGFCDLRWWVADSLGLDNMKYQAPVAGTRFYRGAQEYFLYS